MKLIKAFILGWLYILTAPLWVPVMVGWVMFIDPTVDFPPKKDE